MCTQDSDRVESMRFRGRSLCLRELRADDRGRIEALLAQMAASDLQMRFCSALRPLPPELIDHLMRIDRTQRLTVAAVLGSNYGGRDTEIVAVARAHRTVCRSAEAALLVRSDLKGHGLGSLLLGRLIARSRKSGISRLIAEVTRSNSRMLRLAAKCGFRCESMDYDTCHLILDLGARSS